MRPEMSLGQPWWSEVASLLVAAGLAIWLLLQPGLIQGLPFSLRLPAILLGVWALGAAFVRPLSSKLSQHWPLRALSPPWNHLALVLFTLLVVARALLA